MAKAVRQSTIGRRRKSSLRKTAILGTGRQRSNEGQAIGLSHLRDAAALAVSQVNNPIPPGDSTSRPFSYTNASAASSSDSGWDAPAEGMPSHLQSLGLSTTDNVDSEHKTPRQTAGLGSPIASPITSPTNNPYASTTDDDADGLTFSRPSSLAPHYFPLQPSTTSGISRRRSTKLPGTISGSTTRRSSPLSLPPATLDLDEWDYSETEWWGWVVLVVTWIVFVVGMGSCLEVWSWAWDVGETPYAPPELEDDPTLPIVGYYPALMVLTAVMAWVWVVVAWVGMKYFRHAKVVGEDA
ncbi:hypothetical protein K490DRAFT_74321 [Saccharata proteae CBS 121410]|uniref:Uncharacterized protein n=1 Tax=Saccharata proteae CBS 121410 TaxID=1314787 RepID=A0A9P4HRP0_9PEZI|nr:hypothetical protein K490DRAFT_74321 [Saccharata proteae CBS 121410]